MLFVRYTHKEVLKKEVEIIIPSSTFKDNVVKQGGRMTRSLLLRSYVDPVLNCSLPECAEEKLLEIVSAKELVMRYSVLPAILMVSVQNFCGKLVVIQGSDLEPVQTSPQLLLQVRSNYSSAFTTYPFVYYIDFRGV